MDDDAIALVRQLCTQAGMIMEDASARAVLVGGLGAGELAEVVRVTRQELAGALAIVDAAAVILVPLE